LGKPLNSKRVLIMTAKKLIDLPIKFLILSLSLFAVSLAQAVDSDGDGLSDSYETNYGTVGLKFAPIFRGSSRFLVPFETFSLDPANSADGTLDTDGDGIPDYYEHITDGLSYTNYSDATADFDSDGLSNILEFQIGTNINSSDTDADGIPDAWEYNNGLNPLSSDLTKDNDGDGLSNVEEYKLGTAINNRDTDGDGLSDGYEVNYRTVGLKFAPIFRGSSRFLVPIETFGLDPFDPTDGALDTDNDGIPDYYEHITDGLSYINSSDATADFDSDSLSNLLEFQIGTNINSSDTDSDGIPDAWEYNNGLNPRSSDLNKDNDGDGLSNVEEYKLGTAINNSDTDGDGLSDGYEVNYRTVGLKFAPIFRGSSRFLVPIETFGLDPFDPTDSALDTDNDGIPDYYEHVTEGLSYTSSSDGASDYDGDGLTNLQEFLSGTNMYRYDTDGDGYSDALEAYSTYITPASPDDSEVYVDTNSIEDGEYFYINPPNEAGISINRVDSFDVFGNGATGEKLTLVNLPKNNNTDSSDVAETIVIIASGMTLENAVIDLLGPSADLVLISNGTAGINCFNCTLKGFQRITLAVTGQAPSDSAQTIGSLSSINNGEINLEQFTAPGSLAVDMLADNIVLQGDISTVMAVRESDEGGFEEDSGCINNYDSDESCRSVGTGSLNLYMGEVTWNYESQTATSVSPQYDTSKTIGGNVHSPSFRILSSEALIVNTNVNTQTDLLSTASYKGNIHVVTESINLSSFGQGVFDGLAITGNIVSDGEIHLRSDKHVFLMRSASITSNHKMDVVARSTIINASNIKGTSINMMAEDIKIEGHIEGTTTLKLWAKNNLYNQFGGMIKGDHVILHAKDGFVLNGSRTPYKPNLLDEFSLLELDESDLTMDWESLIGTFYNGRFDVDLSASSPYKDLKADEFSAHIIANDLEIYAKGLENINPYWEPILDDGPVAINPKYARQISIRAQNTLKIETSNYVLNSSAILAIENESGLLHIDSPIVINERYRSLVLLDTDTSTYHEAFLEDANDSPTLEIAARQVSSRFYTYSPPGTITSMGDFYLNADKGFLNNISYVEIMGNAELKSILQNDEAKIFDLGIEQGGFTQLNPVNMGRDYNSCSDYLGLTSCPITFVLPLWGAPYNPKEQDSLFFVLGDIFGEESVFESKKYKPYELYEKNAIEKFKNEMVAQSSNSGTIATEGEATKIVDPLISTWTYTSPNYSSTTTLTLSDIVHRVRVEITAAGSIVDTIVVDLIDLMEQTYSDLQIWVTDLIAEYVWWEGE